VPSPSPTLVAEATRRSGVVWVSEPGGAPRLVWHVWHDGAMYVLTGGPEQASPVAGVPATAVVTVRSKGTQSGRVVEWPAQVDAVTPGTALWSEVLPLLAADRLNAPAGQSERWAAESTVLRFVPVG
jgi:hypothetical protein